MHVAYLFPHVVAPFSYVANNYTNQKKKEHGAASQITLPISPIFIIYGYSLLDITF